MYWVMSDILQEDASEVKVVLSPEVKERIEALTTENPEAYELYLKGKENEMMHLRSPSDAIMGNAIHLFQQAIELDSQFALAYVPLGNLIFDYITEKNTSPQLG